MKLSIREAAQKLKVETHVLRFWEEELGLLIPRNEMGHRYYSEHELEILKDVQKLKEKGFSLRAIKILLPETELVNQLDDFGLEILKEELEKRFHDDEETSSIPKIMVQPIHNEEEREEEDEVLQNESLPEPENCDVPGINPGQLMDVLKGLFAEMLKENNNSIITHIEAENSRTAKQQQKYSEGILKELDYRLRMQEEQQEQFLKNMEEIIKSCQDIRKQTAAASAPGRRWGFFGKKL